MDDIGPTGLRFGSEAEWEWWQSTLGDRQREYLRMLAKVKDLNLPADADHDPLVKPIGLPKTTTGKPPLPAAQCFGMPVNRMGGNTHHDNYALKVTGSPYDYYVQAPSGSSINYDGLTLPSLVWEVKTGHGWMFNPRSQTLALLRIAEWDAQRARGLEVAAACRYRHVWSVTDRWIQESLMIRWGGNPVVFNYPQ
jgi:hypothetical protein